jgi:hypothetical protein
VRLAVVELLTKSITKMPEKKEIRIVSAAASTTASKEAGGPNIYRDTTVPLSVQPKNVRDTSEVSTPYSKKKQVRQLYVTQLCRFPEASLNSAPADDFM